ncbi:MAG: tetratricopeptide repeat protein [Acidobacteria bacterium]|nr:tetratricopeptide repeat protein [Acidobacteriota bacterium]
MKKFLDGNLFMTALVASACFSVVLIVLALQRPAKDRAPAEASTATSLPPGHPPVAPGDGSESMPGADKAPDKALNKAKEEEVHSLEKLLKENTDHTPILFRLAELSREMGKLSEAVGYLKDILKKDPDNSDGHLELGRVLHELGDTKASIDEMNMVLAKNSRQVDALYNLGAIHANEGNLDQAQRYWNQAVASDPDSESGKNAHGGLQKISGPVSWPAASRPTSGKPTSEFDFSKFSASTSPPPPNR